MHRMLLLTVTFASLLPIGPALADDPGPAPMATMERQFMNAIPNVATEKRREFISGFFSVHEHRHLYGEDLAKAFDAINIVSPDRVDQAVVQELEGIIKKYACGRVFEQMSNMGPVMRAYELAANCPPKGDRAIEPDLAANTPLAILLTVTMMEARARDKGFDLSPLHKAAVRLLLNPLSGPTPAVVTITITMDAVWVDSARVIHLTCKGDPDDNKSRCKRQLSNCVGESKPEECANLKMTLEPTGDSSDKTGLPKLAPVLKERLDKIREMQDKMSRKHEVEFALFVDAAVPFQLVTRALYTAMETVPEKDRSLTKTTFHKRPPD